MSETQSGSLFSCFSASSPAQRRHLMEDSLLGSITKAKECDVKTDTRVQTSFWESMAGHDSSKLISITNLHTSEDVIKATTEKLPQGLRLPADETKGEYQLWAEARKGCGPYPFVGHEYPFSMKTKIVPDLLQRLDLEPHNLTSVSMDTNYAFILRRNFPESPTLAEQVKKLKKGRKTAISWPIVRNLVKNENSIDSPTKGYKLFGLRLSVLCVDDQLPVPIMNMLRQLFSKGPYTVGIFRKSANARVCREIKAQLEEDPDSALDEVSVIVVASIFKEFLRSLPDFLLQARLYNKWLEVVNLENQFECREKMSSLVQTLPPEHLLLLRHFLCVLWHIASRASENKMCSMNLGVCIGPSLLSNNSTSYPQRCDEVSKQVPKLISYLIDHCPDLFGEKVLNLFGKQEEVREDSREEESDNLSSLQERSNSSGDNSSIDSLERDLIGDKQKATSTYGNKLSPSNLSIDTDTHLYNPEEEHSKGYSNTSNGLNMLYSNKKVPRLNSVEFKNDINVTLSYARGVGISIDGSCPEVVRKRKSLGLIVQNVTKKTTCPDGAELVFPRTSYRYRY